ncbi:shikimate dehydrogenase [Candidatus Pacearchaeota archaeon]|nr:shikimate dehydrogenase [Candidatus Pacearchaeota archaeon]
MEVRKFGLIGKKLAHSLSKKYFEDKFSKEGIKNCSYELIELSDISALLEATYNFNGFNVTIPYKESIIPFLDLLDADAKEIGAVNVVKIDKGKLSGYNTDFRAFMETIKKLNLQNEKALVLGTGGASKAVCYALKKLGIAVSTVSREKEDSLKYEDLTEEILKSCKLIVNTTPLGMFPNINDFPNIPYNFLTKEHLLYDLTFNPVETEFLKKGKSFGAKTKNGQEMFELQAELSWKIWNS